MSWNPHEHTGDRDEHLEKENAALCARVSELEEGLRTALTAIQSQLTITQDNMGAARDFVGALLSREEGSDE